MRTTDCPSGPLNKSDMRLLSWAARMRTPPGWREVMWCGPFKGAVAWAPTVTSGNSWADRIRTSQSHHVTCTDWQLRQVRKLPRTNRLHLTSGNQRHLSRHRVSISLGLQPDVRNQFTIAMRTLASICVVLALSAGGGLRHGSGRNKARCEETHYDCQSTNGSTNTGTYARVGSESRWTSR